MGKYDKGIIPVNIVFGIGRGLIPQIYFKAPTITVKPRPSDPQAFAVRMQSAKILEAIDAYLVQQMQLKKTLKLVTLDAFLYNVGILKVGYHSLETELPAQDEEADEMMEAIEELTGAPPDYPRQSRRDWYGYHDLVKPNMPWVLRTSPKNFVVPPGAHTIEEAPWCAFRFVRRLDEIMASTVYPMHLKRGLRPNAKAHIDGEGPEVPKEVNQTGVGTDDDYVEGWEIWDKRTGRITVVAEGHPKYLRDEEHGMEMDCLPVAIMQFNSVGDDFWGISHVDAIAPQVSEYNETRTHEMLHRKVASLQLLIDKTIVDPADRLKMEQGDVGPIIWTNGAPGTSYAWLQPRTSLTISRPSSAIIATRVASLNHLAELQLRLPVWRSKTLSVMMSCAI